MALQKRKIELDTRNYNFGVTIKFGPRVDPSDAEHLTQVIRAAIHDFMYPESLWYPKSLMAREELARLLAHAATFEPITEINISGEEWLSRYRSYLSAGLSEDSAFMTSGQSFFNENPSATSLVVGGTDRLSYANFFGADRSA